MLSRETVLARQERLSIGRLALFAVLVSLQAPGSPGAEARAVRIGVFPAAPLVSVRDGPPEGLFIDLIDHFARSSGWRVSYVQGAWSELLIALAKGDIDLLPAVGHTADRESIYDFSRNPVYIDSGVLFTSPRLSLHTVFDLKGKRVAGVEGSVFTTGFAAYISAFGLDCDIILTKDNRAVMEAIAEGAADAGVCIYSLGNELAREFPVVVTPISFSPVALEFAVPEGRNADLLADIDRMMAPMIEDPESLYSQAFKKWTIRPEAKEMPRWIPWGIAGLLALGFFLGSWSYILKRQVVAKTEHLELEIAVRTRAEEEIKRSLAEKEALLRELYHRTKNTMQSMLSMISLQASEYPGNEELQRVIRDTEDRIQAISLVHQMLYESGDLSGIPIADYMRELTAMILQNFSVRDGKVSLDLRVEDRRFILDTAIPLGLIVNELMANSLKHAFPGERKGRISIELAVGETGAMTLRYSDDGIGVPPGFDFRNNGTLGLELIHSIGERQLNGKVVFECAGGVTCLIETPSVRYEERV